jgi:hypothetical protein
MGTGPTAAPAEQAANRTKAKLQTIRDSALARIPGTLAFYQQFQFENARWVNGRFDLAEQIDVVEPQLRSELSQQIQEAEVRLAPTHYWEAAPSRFGSSPIVASLVVLASIGLGLGLALAYGNDLATTLASWGITLALTTFITFLPYRPQFAQVINPLVLPWFAVLLIGYGIGSFLLLDFPEWGGVGVGSGLASAAVLSACVLTIVGLAWLAAVLGRNHMLRAHPDALVVDCLLGVTTALQETPPAKMTLSERNTLSWLLELAAQATETFLPRKLRGSGPVTTTVLAESAAEMAECFRQAGREILLPNSLGHQRLVTRLARMLCRAASGEWGRMPREAPQKLSREQQRSRLAGILGMFVRALLPLAVLLIVQQTNWSLDEGQLKDYAVFGTLAWAVLNVLVQFDPSLSTRLADFDKLKDVVSIPGLGKR